VIEQNYLNELDDNTLDSLHAKLLQAQFRDSSLGGDESFFAFYNKHIHRYIGAPYREDANVEIKIMDISGIEPWRVESTMEFTCRKNSGKIQQSVVSIPDPSQLLEKITISLRRPASTEDILLYNSGPEGSNDLVKQADLDLLVTGVRLDAVKVGELTNDFTDCNKLKVTIRTVYRMRKPGALTFSVVLPTKRLHMTVSADQKYELVPELFVSQYGDATTRNSSGLLSVQYNDWMLPSNGVIVRMLQKNSPSSMSETNNSMSETNNRHCD